MNDVLYIAMETFTFFAIKGRIKRTKNRNKKTQHSVLPRPFKNKSKYSFVES